MTIKYIPHLKIDKIKWDEALQQASNPIIYAHSWYLDCVCPHKWDALMSDDGKWIMPLPLKKKWGIHYLPTPYFVQQLGIFGPGDINEEIIKIFMEALPSRIKLIEYQFNHQNLKLLDIRIAAVVRRNIILNINSDFREQKNYNTNTIRNIKKATSAQFQIKPCEPNAIINLFKQDRGKKFNHLKSDWYKMFNSLCETVSMNAKLIASGAYNGNGELIGGIVVFVAFNRHILIATGKLTNHKAGSVMHFLLDNHFQNMESGEIFDFEGSDNQNLALFYKGFGAIESNYLHLKINNLPFWLKWIKK